MRRIAGPTVSGSPPIIGSDTPQGYPTAGDPGSGIPPTILTAEWVHSVTEEILSTVAYGLGAAPSASLTQLRDSIRLISGRVTTGLGWLVSNTPGTSSTILLSARAYYRGGSLDLSGDTPTQRGIVIWACGGGGGGGAGGGGGGGIGRGGGGGGGGSGSVNFRIAQFPVSLPSSYTGTARLEVGYTIGAGGSAGAGGAGNGGNGGPGGATDVHWARLVDMAGGALTADILGSPVNATGGGGGFGGFADTGAGVTSGGAGGVGTVCGTGGGCGVDSQAAGYAGLGSSALWGYGTGGHGSAGGIAAPSGNANPGQAGAVVVLVP